MRLLLCGSRRLLRGLVFSSSGPSRPLDTKRRQLQLLDKPIQDYMCKLVGHACTEDHECCEELLCTHPDFDPSEPSTPDSRGTCQLANNVAGYARTPPWGRHEDGSPHVSLFASQGRSPVRTGPPSTATAAGFLGRWRLPRNSRMLQGGEEEELRIEESR